MDYERRVLTVEGELDLATSPSFERTLLAAVAATEPGGELVVDLGGVQFFDVSALRALLRAADAAQTARIPLRLTASPAVNRVFDVLKIDTPPATDGSPRTPPAPVAVNLDPARRLIDNQQASSPATTRQTLRARPVTTGNSECAETASIAVNLAAGILAEREMLSPAEAIERMQARAALDGISMTYLARRIVKLRGWPPARSEGGA